MVRTLWACLVGLAVTGYWSVRLLANKALGGKRQLEVGAQALKGWSRGILWGAGVTVRYENGHRLPVDEPHVLVANHQSWFDVFALAGTLEADVRFVGKKELSEIFLFGPAWLSAGHYAIDRSDRQSAINSLNAIVSAMHEQRHAVILFPEGTRSSDGRLGLFKKGAFVMAINAQVPVVPLAVMGSREIMAKGRWKVRPGEITVRVGKPISTKGYTLEDRNRLTLEAKQTIADLKGEVLSSGSMAQQVQDPDAAPHGGSLSAPMVPHGTPTP